MGTILLLAEGTAEWPATVPAPVHQPWHPLVAGQAYRLWVVVRTNCSWDIIEQDLPRGDVPRSHKKAATPVLMKDSVWQALVVFTVGVLHLAGGGAVAGHGAGGAGQGGVLLRTYNTGTTSYHFSL